MCEALAHSEQLRLLQQSQVIAVSLHHSSVTSFTGCLPHVHILWPLYEELESYYTSHYALWVKRCVSQSLYKGEGLGTRLSNYFLSCSVLVFTCMTTPLAHSHQLWSTVCIAGQLGLAPRSLHHHTLPEQLQTVPVLHHTQSQLWSPSQYQCSGQSHPQEDWDGHNQLHTLYRGGQNMYAVFSNMGVQVRPKSGVMSVFLAIVCECGAITFRNCIV